ncbi:hypothetical protein BGX20_004689 [Mortierella sp. AD010]|nr:hypothetical protein BGX20_004689 [Mortierella sp. AD010]
MAIPEIINLIDTDDEEFYNDLGAQRTTLNWDGSSDVKVEDMDKNTPQIIDLTDSDDDDFYDDPRTQQAILNWEDSSDDMKVKHEDLDQEYNTPSPCHHDRERNETGPSGHGQGSGLSFIHVGTSEKARVPARPCRLIVEEESESDAEDYSFIYFPSKDNKI